MTLEQGCQGLAYTYNQPTIFIEFARDIGMMARKAGLLNIFVSNGYDTPETVAEMPKFLDCVTVDFKGSGETNFVRKYINIPNADPIFQTLLDTRDTKKIHIEITDLIVPQVGDDLNAARKLSKWVYDNLGPDTPIHFLRFHPDYKMMELPWTPVETLEKHCAVAQEEGLKYVYIGNGAGHPHDHSYGPGRGAVADLPGTQPPPVPPRRAGDGPGGLSRRNRAREDRLLRDHDLAREDAFPRAVLRAPRDAEPRGRATGARTGVRRAPSPAWDRPLRRGLPRPPRASAVHEVRDVPADDPVHRRGKADETDCRRSRATTGRTHREVHNACERPGGGIRSPAPCGSPRCGPTLLRHGRQGFAVLYGAIRRSDRRLRRDPRERSDRTRRRSRPLAQRGSDVGGNHESPRARDEDGVCMGPRPQRGRTRGGVRRGVENRVPHGVDGRGRHRPPRFLPALRWRALLGLESHAMFRGTRAK